MEDVEQQRVHDVAFLYGDDAQPRGPDESKLPSLIDMQLRMVAVVPWIGHAEAGLHAGIRQMRYALELGPQYLLAKAQLCFIVDVLPLAAAAGAEMRTPRVNSLRRSG